MQRAIDIRIVPVIGRLSAFVAAFALSMALIAPSIILGSTEETFDVLRIGTVTYRNVTVTTKAPTYIFILHSAGMTNIRVDDLPPEVRVQLGYTVPEPATDAAKPAPWSNQIASNIERSQLGRLGKSVQTGFGQYMPSTLSTPAFWRSTGGFIALGVSLLTYIFFCLCAKLIVEKTGNDPGLLIWLPILQWVPLFRAAGMPGWWLLAGFIPGLNLVAYLIWSLNIAKARDKSPLIGILLWIPGLNVVAFLYLAFAYLPPPPKPMKGVGEIMTLETA